MIVYLAGPIDSVPLDGGGELRTRDLRAQCLKAIQNFGWSAYDPSSAFPSVRDTAGVVAVNQAAMEAADAVLAFLPEGVRSVGTPIEIAQAQQLEKPLAVIHEGHPGVQLRGMDIRVYGVGSIDQAVRDLERQHRERRRGQVMSIPVQTDERTRWVTERQLSLLDDEPDELVIHWTGEGESPNQEHPGDAGLDLTCSQSVQVQPGSFVDIPCNVRVAFPEGVWGMIVGRSSTLRKKGLLVAQGIIDQGYRGELFCGLWNLTDEPVWVSEGERVAQLIPLPLLTDRAVLEWIGQLPEHVRGERGFGSSGD